MARRKITPYLWTTAVATLVATAILVGPWGHPSREARHDPARSLDQRRGRPPPELVGAREAAIAGDQTHLYSIALETRQYLHLVVEQSGADVVVTLLDPAGRELVGVDSADGAWGPEELHFIAARGGDHVVRIRPFRGSEPGRYRITVTELRTATPRDHERVLAAEAFAHAAALEATGRVEALEAAAEGYEAAAARWQELHEPLPEALSALRLGRVRFRLGEVAVAVGHYQRALDLLGATEHRGQEASALSSMAQAERLSGRPERALAANRKALEIYRELGDRRGQALSLNNLAVLADTAGEIEEALRLYEQALEIWQGLDEPAERATTLHNMGTLYTLLGEDAEALDFLDDALALRRRARDRGGEAATLTAIGWAHHLLAEPEQAVAYLRQALRLRRAAGDRRGEATTLDRLATTLVALGRRREALDAYQRAETALLEIGDRFGRANVLANLGSLHLGWNHPERALAYFHEALPLLREIGDRSAEAAALTERARAERALGELEEARVTLAQAVALLETQSRSAARPGLRSSFLASRYDSYELYVDLLMELHRRQPEAGWDARALEVRERARGQALVALLHDARAEIEDDLDPELLERRRELGARIDDQQQERSQRIGRGAPDQEIAALDRELRLGLLELESLRAEIRRRSPRYAAWVDPAPLTVERIQQEILDEDTALLVFSLGEERSFVWLVTRQTLISRSLPTRQDIELWARRSHLLLAASHQREARTQAGIATAALANMLLGPLADRLDCRRLVVAPDGALHYVPFGALPKPGSSGPDAKPLLADHEILQVPSLAVLESLRRETAHRPAAPGTIAVVADPVFDPGDPRLPRLAGESVSGRLGPDEPPDLPRLPYSRQEADSILGLVPAGDRFAAIGFDANRETMLSGRLRPYRILHIATHAVLDTEHPQLSGLVLSRFDASGQPRRGFLRAHELYGLELGADLVVLSGCRTALGREVRGEGLAGLASGFLHAGAPRVLMSLWSVSDRATAELMRRFYHGLLVEGLEPAAALRQAQLSMAGEPRWRSPYFWAGFALLGEWRDRRSSHSAGSLGSMESEQPPTTTRKTGGCTMTPEQLPPAPAETTAQTTSSGAGTETPLAGVRSRSGGPTGDPKDEPKTGRWAEPLESLATEPGTTARPEPSQPSEAPEQEQEQEQDPPPSRF